MKKSMFVLGTAILMVIILASCGPASTPVPQETEPAEAPAATQPGPTVAPAEPTAEPEPIVLRIGREGDLVDCLNPAYCEKGYNAWQVLYDAVMSWGAIGDPVQPRLAESWDVSDDLMTYTFHLRDLTGMTFHDGTPLDAEAIAWAMNYWAQNPAISWMYGLTDTSEGVFAEVVDDRTITLQINEAVSPAIMENYLGYIYVLPRHIWEQYDENTIYDFENLEAVGTGPLKLGEWNPGQYMIFDANANYYEGKPPVDRVVIQFYAQQDAMVQALIAGEIDAIMNFPGSFVDRLGDYPQISVFEKPPLYENHLFFNMYGDAGLGNPALMDLNVRKAVAHAIDKQQIVDVAWSGRAIPADSFWDGGARWEAFKHPTLKAYSFDLDLAASILDDAGYVDSDGDGVREMNDGSGEPLNLRILFESDQAEQFSTVEMIAEWLKEIGIETQSEALDPSTLNDVLTSTDFDLVVSQYGFDWDPDWQMFVLSSYAIDWGLNWPGYSDAEWDDLYLAQHYASTPEERLEYLYGAQENLHENVPWIQLDSFYSYDSYRNDRFEFTVQDSEWESWHWYSIYGIVPAE
jgi:peptide/nickel transport system substrate-binding protein